MSKYKRVQIPMDPAELKRLQIIAPIEQDIRKQALVELLSLGQIPVQNWRAMKKKILGRHGAAQAPA